MCTSVDLDNTSVNIGILNSLKTRIHHKNPAVYINGCPCHLIHNATRKASDCFCDVCGFDVEELSIDLYYWFEKSLLNVRMGFTVIIHFVIRNIGPLLSTLPLDG